jgi:hypothetical protein
LFVTGNGANVIARQPAIGTVKLLPAPIPMPGTIANGTCPNVVGGQGEQRASGDTSYGYRPAVAVVAPDAIVGGSPNVVSEII